MASAFTSPNTPASSRAAARLNWRLLIAVVGTIAFWALVGWLAVVVS